MLQLLLFYKFHGIFIIINFRTKRNKDIFQKYVVYNMTITRINPLFSRFVLNAKLFPTVTAILAFISFITC